MSVWTWVLIGLCVAGALLALISLVLVAVQALRLRARLQELRNSRLFLSAELLQIQTARLSRLSAQVQPLTQRAQTAIAVIKGVAEESRFAEASAALNETGAEISALIDDLR